MAIALSQAPKATSTATHKSMVGNRRRDSRPEMSIRRAVHALGLRYFVDKPVKFEIHSRSIRADLVFPRIRLAVFIDGCFWHGCPEHMTWPSRNGRWWRSKIADNQARDRRQTRQLGAARWTVIRIWSHSEPSTAARRIDRAVRSARRRCIRIQRVTT